MRRLKKHQWLPIVLLAYCAVMAYAFRETLTVYHDYVRYFTTLGVELAVIVALYFFLRKRDKLKREREEADKRLKERDSITKN